MPPRSNRGSSGCWHGSLLRKRLFANREDLHGDWRERQVGVDGFLSSLLELIPNNLVVGSRQQYVSLVKRYRVPFDSQVTDLIAVPLWIRLRFGGSVVFFIA